MRSGWSKAVRDQRALGVGALLAYAVIAISLLLYIQAYRAYPMVPTRAAMNSGWWNWTDQGRYYRETLAWASGDLRPSQHWYLPLYSLIGAVFLAFDHADPYGIPDAICFVLSGLLMSALAPRLAPTLPFARLWGAAAFWLADVWQEYALKSWIEPWTTTPTTPLLLGLLLAALRLRERPGAVRAATCGGLWGLILMARPTEATWSSLPAIVYCAAVVIRAPLPALARLRISISGIAAALILVAITVWLHWIVWGWSWGDYFLQSLGTGFELRLLPLRWNWLVLDSRPAHEAFKGLGSEFFWVLPGFAGILAGMIRRRNRTTHLLVGSAVIVHWVVYLCYRDLHPEGLWRFGNYHYFKWTQPVLCFYTLLLLIGLMRRASRGPAIVGIVAVLLCCCWHVRMQNLPGAGHAVTVLGEHDLLIHGGLVRPDQAVLVATDAVGDAIYNTPQGFDQAGRSWGYNGDVKAWPLPGGLAFATLRALPAGDGVLHLDHNVTVKPDTHPRVVRMHLVFGLPCAIAPHRRACRPNL